MTAEEASKLKRGQVVIWDDRQFSIGAGRPIKVETAEIKLGSRCVTLTMADGEEIECLPEKLTLARGKVRKSPCPYSKGDEVRDIRGDVYTVIRSYWQAYAGSGDYTVELESIDPSQPTPWNKSRNLTPI